MFRNKVMLLGRIVADPDVRTVADTAVCNFRVAVNRAAKKGEHPEADFIDCVAWGSTADVLSRYFKRGSRIGIEGRLQVDNYETKDGEKRRTTKVRVDEIEFIERRDSGDSSGDNQRREHNNNKQSYNKYNNAPANNDDDDEDNYPF